MHTTAEEYSKEGIEVKQCQSMTAYVRMKSSAGIIRHYPKVRSIDWINDALIILTESEEVILREVFTCEIN